MKGIIFDAESVKAILAGNKTQSRRIIKGARLDDNELLSGHHPRYYVGETVYIKEAYAIYGVFGSTTHYHYKADGALSLDYKTPLFMPESLSRIKLRILRVGCERLHDISLEDIQKEGITPKMQPLLLDEWRDRWVHVNGRASWESNPWVWVYEFERVA